MKKLLFLLLLSGSALGVHAQLWGGGVDDEDYNFGFTFQYVSSEFKILKKKDWRSPFVDPFNGLPATDSLNAIYAKQSPGFGLGFVFNYSLRKNVDIRVTPALVFNDRLVYYEFQNTPDPTERKLQATMAEFPVGIKLKSNRRGNFRAYMLAGGKYSFDIASRKKQDDDGRAPVDRLLKSKRNYLSYEAALGLDLYFEYFKLSPEVKLSYSVRDNMVHDSNPYSAPIDKLMLRHFTFSLFIE